MEGDEGGGGAQIYSRGDLYVVAVLTSTAAPGSITPGKTGKEEL